MSTAIVPNRNFWRGHKIRLRAFEASDLDAILTDSEEPDTEIERYEDAIGYPLARTTSRAEMEKLIGTIDPDSFLFLLMENLQGEVVGYINSFDCERRPGTFKYALAVKHRFWRNGYGREAAQIFLRYYFRELRYQKCTSTVYAFNEASIRFHEALGFQLEGRLRNMIYTNGEYFDTLYFGITAAEWNEVDPPLTLPRITARGESS